MTCSTLLGSARTRPSGCVGRRHELDVFAEDPLEHLVHTREHVVQVEHLRREHLLAAEHEELPREVGGAQSGLTDLLDVVAHRVARLHFGEEHLAVAEDDGQHVVEVVRDASCEPPDRLHLLRLAELFLESESFGHVPSHGKAAFAPIQCERVRDDFHLHDVAVLFLVPPYANLCESRLASGLEKRRHVLGRASVRDRHREELLAGVPVLANGGFVHREEAQRLQVVHPLRERAFVEHQPVVRLPLP